MVGSVDCVFGLKLFYLYSFLHSMYYLDVFLLCFPHRTMLSIVYGFFWWIRLGKVLV